MRKNNMSFKQYLRNLNTYGDLYLPNSQRSGCISIIPEITLHSGERYICCQQGRPLIIHIEYSLN